MKPVDQSFEPLNSEVIYICYLPGGRSVWEKIVPEVLSTRAVLKIKLV